MDSIKVPDMKLNISDYTYYFRFIKPQWVIVLACVLTTIGLSLAQSLTPYIGKLFIDKVALPAVPGSITGDLMMILAIFIVLSIAICIFSIALQWLTMRFQQELLYGIQTTLFENVVRYPLHILKEKRIGYLMSRLSDDIGLVQYFFSQFVMQMLSNIFYLAFGLIIIVTINVKVALLFFMIIPVFFIVDIYLGRKMRSFSYRERETGAQLSGDMQEVLSGVETVKSYSAEQKETGRVSKKLRDLIQARMMTAMFSVVSNNILQGIQFMLTIMLMLFSAYEITGGSMTIGDYVALTGYTAIFSGSVKNVFTTYIIMQPIMASMYRLKEMFAIAPEEASSKGTIKPETVEGDIRFEHISFAYDGKNMVIRDLDLAAGKGKPVMLMGESGVGKTTLVNLLLKFYQPSSGSITLDGIPIKDIDTKWLRERIGFVSQDIFLFNETIENNIKYGCSGASKIDVIMAAKKAHIHEFIARLPGGYDTIVGEKGYKLSAGQRQRVSLARALLKDAPILILDEPTSALDQATESLISETIREVCADKTVIVISHKPAVRDGTFDIVKLEDAALSSLSYSGTSSSSHAEG